MGMRKNVQPVGENNHHHLLARQYNSVHIYVDTVLKSRTARSDKNTYILGQLSLASLRGRLIEYQLRLG